jgi:hypothetical protein
MGAIHHLHGAAGLRGQLRTLRRHLDDFGVAAPCGFGPVPERPGRLLSEQGAQVPPDFLEIIVRDHLDAVQALRDGVGD